MTTADVARSTIVVFVVLVVQHTLVDFVRLKGAHPDLMLLLPVAAGYVGGPERGAWFGFITGLLADLFLPTTFGLSALVGCLLGYSVGLATSGLVRTSWWLPPVVSAAATTASMFAYAILGALLGQSQQLKVFLPPALVVGVPAAAIVAIPLFSFVGWAVPRPSTGSSSGALATGATR
jgi:rod shape-determining protein MreD